MFITPIPPTSRETAATAPNRMVEVRVVDCDVAGPPDPMGLLVQDQVGQLEPGAGPALPPRVRRRMAWMRATTSSKLNGLVT